MELISIIIPCYNQAEYLSEALDSVIAQTFPNWECIVVNDGSTDNSEDIAMSYCRKDTRIRCVSQANQGLSMARNNGINEAHGTFILPLDADDKIAPTYIEKAVLYLSDHPECKLVYCLADFFGIEKGRWKLPEYCYEKILWENCIFCSAVYRRSDFLNTNGYNPNMRYGLEDWDFLLSFLSPNDKVYRINEVLFYYRKKKSSMSVDLSRNGLRDMYQQIFQNHQDIYSQYVKDIVFYHHQMMREQERNIRITHSCAYRLYRLLTYPFRCVRNFYRTHLV